MWSTHRMTRLCNRCASIASWFDCRCPALLSRIWTRWRSGRLWNLGSEDLWGSRFCRTGDCRRRGRCRGLAQPSAPATASSGSRWRRCGSWRRGTRRCRWILPGSCILYLARAPRAGRRVATLAAWSARPAAAAGPLRCAANCRRRSASPAHLLLLSMETQEFYKHHEKLNSPALTISTGFFSSALRNLNRVLIGTIP